MYQAGFCHEVRLFSIQPRQRLALTVWSGPACVVRTASRVGPLQKETAPARGRAEAFPSWMCAGSGLAQVPNMPLAESFRLIELGAPRADR